MVALVAAPIVSGLTSLGMSAATAALAANVVIYAGVTAASYYLTQANQTRPESGTKLSAASGGDVPLSMIFGEKETAGSLIYAGTWGRVGKTPNAFYTRVYCLSDYPCTAMLSRCWHDGNKGTIDLETTSYTASDGATSGTAIGHPITSLDYKGKHWAWAKFLDGSQTVADPFLMEVFGGLASRPWTSDMIGRGRALLIVTQRYNRKQPTAAISLVPVIQGAKLYNWRKDSTNGGTGTHRWDTPSTHEYESDPITIAYNIKRGIRYGGEVIYGGQNWSARRLDNDSYTAAANVCDENVALAAGGTQKRYRVGGEVSFDEQPLDVIDRLLASCAGRMLESGGIYKVSAGGIGASVYSFTDDDVVISEAMTGQMFPSREDICNTITGTYVEPDDGGQMTAYKKRTRADYLAADNGEVRSKPVDYDYVRDNVRAQRLSQLALNDNRRFLTKVVTFPSIARKLEPYDTINWSGSDRFGFVNKKFITGDVTLNDNGTVSIPIREVDATDADWVVGDEHAYTVGLYGDIVPETQTIVISVSAYGIKNNAGTFRRPGLKITWTDDADDVDCKAVRYRVRLLDTSYMVAQGRVEWDEAQAIISEGIDRNEAYQVQAIIIPYSDRDTEWCAWQTVTATEYGVIGEGDLDDTPPPNMPNNDEWLPTVSNKPVVTSDAERDEDGKIVITVTVGFTEHTNQRIDYEVRVAIGAVVKYFRAKSSPIEFKARSGVALSIRTRPISVFGIRGSVSAATSYTPTKKSSGPSDPTGLTVTSDVNGNARYGKMIMEWDYPTDPDYAYTRIRWGGSNVYSESTILKQVKADGWIVGNLGNDVTRYFWIQHYDTSGNPSDNRLPTGAGYRGDTRSLLSADIAPGEVKTANIDNDAVRTAKIRAGDVGGAGAGSGKRDSGNKTTKYTLKPVDLFRKKIAYVNRSGAGELISVSGTLFATVGQMTDTDTQNGSAVITVAFYIQRGSGKITTLARYSVTAPRRKAVSATLPFRELLLAPKSPIGAATTVWATVSISGRPTISSTGVAATWRASCNATASVTFMKA